MADLESQIRELWERAGPARIPPTPRPPRWSASAVTLLDRGEARVAELGPDGEPIVHEWCKQAVLLLFRVSELSVVEAGPFEYLDRLPLKRDFAASRGTGGARRVGPLGQLPRTGRDPDAELRQHRRPGRVRAPWSIPGPRSAVAPRSAATPTSRAGSASAACWSRPQAVPVFVGDECYIGSRCMVVEGARVGDGAVLGRRLHPERHHPGDRRRDGRGAVSRCGPAVVRGGLGHPPADVSRRRVRDALRAGHPAPASPGERHDKSRLNDILRQHGGTL